MDLYISPSGNDAWSGALPDPGPGGGDGPFATLERARDAIRALRRPISNPQSPITVWLRGGDYELRDTFALDERDSGAPGAPIAYRAFPGERPRLLGGKRVTRFQPVSDPAVLERLDASARPRVVEADLAALGIADPGRFRSRGMGRPVSPAHLELFFDGQPMTVARWPNEGFTQIAGWPEAGRKDDEHGRDIGQAEFGFLYDGDRPARWKRFADIWLHGYWAWDWANTYE